MKKNLFTTIMQNYNFKNLTSDFSAHKTKNICILLDEELNDKQSQNIAKKVTEYCNDNYFKKPIIIFSTNKHQVEIVLNYFNDNMRYKKNNLVINNSRNTLYSKLSKISEKKIKYPLIFTPAYNKDLIELYCEKLIISTSDVVYTNTSFITNSIKSYKTNKFYNKIK